MIALLEKRLEQRQDSRSSAYRFDLRHSAFGPLRARSYLTLRDPDAAGWPEKGSTTGDPTTAKQWIVAPGGYADWVLARLGSVRGSVAEAADRYIEQLREERGNDDNTVSNRASCVKVHIKDGLGHHLLEKLDKPTVRTFLTERTVRVAGDKTGKRAAPATIGAIRDTLNAIWASVDPDRAPPWAGLRIKPPSNHRARADAVRAGEVGVGHKVTGYTPEELTRALVAAMWYDLHAIERLPNVVETSVPNTAGIIACYTGCAMRREELAYWRWRHVYRAEGAVWVPGTKNESAPRWTPLQDALLPWLAWLQAQREARGGPVDPASYVASATWKLRADPKYMYKASGRNTYDRRIAITLILAGLKLPQKSTHVWRATHITWAEKLAGLPTNTVQDFVGHSAPYGKTTTKYVDRRPPFFQPEYRRYLQLPTPDEIAALVPTFKPTVSLDEARRLYGARRTMV
jgi:integrase